MRSLRSYLEFEHTHKKQTTAATTTTTTKNTPYYQRLRERLKSRVDAAKVEEILGKKSREQLTTGSLNCFL